MIAGGHGMCLWQSGAMVQNTNVKRMLAYSSIDETAGETWVAFEGADSRRRFEAGSGKGAAAGRIAVSVLPALVIWLFAGEGRRVYDLFRRSWGQGERYLTALDD